MPEKIFPARKEEFPEFCQIYNLWKHKVWKHKDGRCHGMEDRNVLKSYALNDLRAGMVVGRDVLDENANTLVGAGTKLTDEIICSLAERSLFSIYIEEKVQEASGDVPGRDHLLDDAYVTCYDRVYQRLQHVYTELVKKNTLNMEELSEVISDENIKELCDGAKAVSQIHNMSRDGDIVLHHAIHVGILAGLMGRWMRWPAERTRDLVMSGFLCDVGKRCVPPEILEKTGKLTDEELHEIRKHTEHGYNLLKLGPIGSKRDVLFGILQHHERCDGSGYPNGVKREEINEFALILGILDIYDAMAANRVYARKRSPFDVLKVLYEDILDGKLDTEYGVLFMRKLCHSLNGNWVALSDGQKARIVYIDESRVSALPTVQTLQNEFIDLNRRSDIKIESLLTAREVE